MRTTLTLDDDVVEKLRQEMLHRGTSFKDTVNDVIRRGLLQKDQARPAGLHPGRPLGSFPGMEVDNVEELLDQIEGPARR